MIYPELDPWRDPTTGTTTTWMERFKAKQRADSAAYVARRKAEQAAELATTADTPKLQSTSIPTTSHKDLDHDRLWLETGPNGWEQIIRIRPNRARHTPHETML